MGVSYACISGFFAFWLVFSLTKAALTKPGVIPHQFQMDTLDLACQIYNDWAKDLFGLQTLSEKFDKPKDFIKMLFDDRSECLKKVLRKNNIRICKEC